MRVVVMGCACVWWSWGVRACGSHGVCVRVVVMGCACVEQWSIHSCDDLEFVCSDVDVLTKAHGPFLS